MEVYIAPMLPYRNIQLLIFENHMLNLVEGNLIILILELDKRLCSHTPSKMILQLSFLSLHFYEPIMLHQMKLHKFSHSLLVNRMLVYEKTLSHQLMLRLLLNNLLYVQVINLSKKIHL